MVSFSSLFVCVGLIVVYMLTDYCNRQARCRLAVAQGTASESDVKVQQW